MSNLWFQFYWRLRKYFFEVMIMNTVYTRKDVFFLALIPLFHVSVRDCVKIWILLVNLQKCFVYCHCGVIKYANVIHVHGSGSVCGRSEQPASQHGFIMGVHYYYKCQLHNSWLKLIEGSDWLSNLHLIYNTNKETTQRQMMR